MYVKNKKVLIFMFHINTLEFIYLKNVWSEVNCKQSFIREQRRENVSDDVEVDSRQQRSSKNQTIKAYRYIFTIT